MYRIERECIRKSLKLLVSQESSRAASMLLTQELQRGAGISSYRTGRKHIFKFLSVIQDGQECLGGVKLRCWLFTDDTAVQGRSNDTRQKIFVLRL